MDDRVWRTIRDRYPEADIRTYADNEEGFVVPRFYPDDDNIEVRVRQRGDVLSVHDMAETLRRRDGIEGDTTDASFMARVQRVADRRGVSIVRGVLVKRCTVESLASTFEDVLSVCEEVSVMPFLAPRMSWNTLYVLLLLGMATLAVLFVLALDVSRRRVESQCLCDLTVFGGWAVFCLACFGWLAFLRRWSRLH